MNSILVVNGYYGYFFSGYSIYQSYDIYDGLSILLGGDLTVLKNMKVNGKDYIPYIKWKIKND